MKKNFIAWHCLSLLLLASCQQDEFLENAPGDGLALGIQTSVADVVLSRTVNDGKQTTFTSGDKVGFFMPEEDTPVCWTYNGSLWEAETPLFWPDKVSTFSFDAFYPYVAGAQRNRIPMPDLSEQDGDPEKVGAYDFLVAHTSCSYASAPEGKVAFTFGHVCCLLKVTLKDEHSVSMLKTMDFEGKGIVSGHYYDMEAGTMKEPEEPEAGDKLSLVAEDEIEISGKGHTVSVLLNPYSEDQPLTFSVSYTRDGKSYKASTTKMGKSFEAGMLYQYTVTIRKEGLVVEGNSVSDWETGNDMGDIVVDETPVS